MSMSPTCSIAVQFFQEVYQEQEVCHPVATIPDIVIISFYIVCKNAK
jgi:hypothetical protein